MIKLLLIIVIIVGLVIGYFLVIGLAPGFKAPKLALAGLKAAQGASTVSGRRDVSFTVAGT